MKSDKYSKARGGWSRILDIGCSSCQSHVCYYQKDGPGPLKRMYLDRIISGHAKHIRLTCSQCHNELGIYYIYKKENRPSYRLFQNSTTKKIIAQNNIK